MPTLADAIGGKDRVIGGPFGSKLTQADYADFGVPVIRGSNMPSMGKSIGGPFAYVSTCKFERDLRSNSAQRGDIIVTQRGTLGQVGIIADDIGYDTFVVSQSQMAVRVDAQKANRDFVYYFLTSPGFNDYVEKSTIQTGVPHINLGLLRETPVVWPDLRTQAAIAAVLGALDDKIELNRRMNETLEAMARAIFKDWFVDFGPTRAKMEGRAPYLAPDIWSLFPDRLDDEGKPEGWTSYSLGRLASQHTASVAPSSSPNEVFEHFSLPAYDAGRSPTHDLGETIKSNKTTLPKDAVLLSKLNPEIERVWIPEPASGKRQVCSTEFLVFTPHAGGNRPLLFGLFTELSFRTLLQSMVTGTSKSHQRISPPALLGRQILIGSEPTFDQYAAVTEPLLARTLANRSESRTLAATRDFLLPKLMSGEVRVKDAEKLVGEVA